MLSVLPATAWSYAVRTVVCTGLFIWCGPWRWYPHLKIQHLPIAGAAGVLVFILWIAPELPLLANTRFAQMYQLLFILPPWSISEPAATSPYAPEVCGWALSGIRLFGSAVTVALIEEFFWRGFLYRWMFKSNFLRINPARFDLRMFLIVALFFGLEHNRWLVGFAAGLIYGGLYIKTKDIWAVCIAHGITNLLLGIYVLSTGAYAFW